MSGNFELTLNPEDKIAKFSNEDAALYAGNPNNSATMTETPESLDWAKRINQYIAVQRPPEIRFKDLKALVSVRLNYNTLPFNVRADTLRGPGDKTVVPLTFEFDAASLSFQESAQGRKAQVNIYVVVTDLTGRVAYEFEDAVSLNDSVFYQRFIALGPGRYKLSAVAKDAANANTGSREQVIAVARPPQKLNTSSLMLSDILVPAAPGETTLDNFVISRYKVRPLVKQEISKASGLGIYQEIYDYSTNPDTHQPDVAAVLQVFRKGQSAEVLNSPVTSEDLGTRFIDRMLFAKKLQVSDLSSGEYIIRLTITDRLKKESVVSESAVTLKD